MHKYLGFVSFVCLITMLLAGGALIYNVLELLVPVLSLDVWKYRELVTKENPQLDLSSPAVQLALSVERQESLKTGTKAGIAFAISLVMFIFHYSRFRKASNVSSSETSA